MPTTGKQSISESYYFNKLQWQTLSHDWDILLLLRDEELARVLWNECEVESVSNPRQGQGHVTDPFCLRLSDSLL